MPYDWSLLDRYRPFARRYASQAEIYLSRGCPYDCSFCMERAKRETSWRALAPEEAVEELHRLDAWLDLSTWTLRVVDPLFGMKRAWRREFLELLAKRPVRARKTWLLIRVDLVEREDFELMARCNVAPGFGLETGDPEQLQRIRKTGMLSGYLEKMLQVAEWAREYQVPFGANIIVGHPGETEQSLKNTADYVRRLFLDPKGTVGFLSVDPFRLYPGSPIDEQLDDWKARTGFHPHRYPWWEDGDQDFLAEWVDPSATLDYDRRETLTREWFGPIVTSLRDNFIYQGPAADYFRRALDSQVELFEPERYERRAKLKGIWSQLLGLESGQERVASESAPEAVVSTVVSESASDAEISLATSAEPQGSRRPDREAAPSRSLPVASSSSKAGPPLSAASDWFRVVFHVLAHVDVPAFPSTLYHDAYVRRARHYLGAPSERALGQDVAVLRGLATGHDDYSRLQLLAWLFADTEQAVRCAGRALQELEPSDVTNPHLLPLLQQLGPSAELLFCAALLEANTVQALPQLGFARDELRDEIVRLTQTVPHLARYAITLCDSLTVHGRVVGDRIWIGTPNTELGVTSAQVARQAAHEATVREFARRHPGAPEREIERRALDAFRNNDYAALHGSLFEASHPR